MDEPDTHQRDMIAADSKRLTRNYQCVNVVDLEIEIKGRVQPQREFIFRTDSVRLWGADVLHRNGDEDIKLKLGQADDSRFNRLMVGISATP